MWDKRAVIVNMSKGSRNITFGTVSQDSLCPGQTLAARRAKQKMYVIEKWGVLSILTKKARKRIGTN